MISCLVALLVVDAIRVPVRDTEILVSRYVGYDKEYRQGRIETWIYSSLGKPRLVLSQKTNEKLIENARQFKSSCAIAVSPDGMKFAKVFPDGPKGIQDETQDLVNYVCRTYDLKGKVHSTYRFKVGTRVLGFSFGWIDNDVVAVIDWQDDLHKIWTSKSRRFKLLTDRTTPAIYSRFSTALVDLAPDLHDPIWASNPRWALSQLSAFATGAYDPRFGWKLYIGKEFARTARESKFYFVSARNGMRKSFAWRRDVIGELGQVFLMQYPWICIVNDKRELVTQNLDTGESNVWCNDALYAVVLKDK